MKFAVVLLALVSAAVAAPQPRKVFHEHFNDFLEVIEDEVDDIQNDIEMQYMEFDEYKATYNYLVDTDFKELVYEMEDLPEFIAVVNYLESHNVDIIYFITLYNDMLDSIYKPDMKKHAHHAAVSGRDFNSFIRDWTATLPRDQLAALYSQKVAEDKDFKAAMEGIESVEFQNLLDDLFESAEFQAEVQTLADNGVDVTLIYNLIISVFGQEVPVKH